MTLLSGHRIAVLDVETTGWNPAEDWVVEVAGVTLENGIRTDEWSLLVNWARPIPASATRVHGIDDARLAAAPTPVEAARLVHTRCEGHVLALHNARFDLPFLNALLRQAALPPLVAPVIDTLGLARGLPGSDGNTLTELAQRFGIEHSGLHRALPDARVTAELVVLLAERWRLERDAQSLAELAAASQDALRLSYRKARVSAEAARVG